MQTAEVLSSLVGVSPALERARAQVRRLARSPIPVLILGETGTGKEVCAAAIASLSGRAPFRAVNCTEIPESLVESELFGHVRGSFTGAIRDHAGVIANVHGGILFLDELAEIPLNVQAKLLRTLESGEYRPIGAAKTLRSDFRLIAATNEDPDRLVLAGKLRSDLLYRLGCARLRLPPLRERREDIPLLAQTFLRRYRARYDTTVSDFSNDAYLVLHRHHWPGNVRQLLHVVEAAIAVAEPGMQLTGSELLEVLSYGEEQPCPSPTGPGRLVDVVRRAERDAIEEALLCVNGNRERAARLLGISVATLYRKLGEARERALRLKDLPGASHA